MYRIRSDLKSTFAESSSNFVPQYFSQIDIIFSDIFSLYIYINVLKSLGILAYGRTLRRLDVKTPRNSLRRVVCTLRIRFLACARAFQA